MLSSGQVLDSENLRESSLSKGMRRGHHPPPVGPSLPPHSIILGLISSSFATRCRQIDASYLSPNVNLAARLESGTHQVVTRASAHIYTQHTQARARALHTRLHTCARTQTHLHIVVHTSTSDVQRFGYTEFKSVQWRDFEFCNTMREGKINELNMQHIDSHVNIYMYIPGFMSYKQYQS